MNLRTIRNRNKRRIVWGYTYRIGNGAPETRRPLTFDASRVGRVRLDATLPNGQTLTISGSLYLFGANS